jgi:flagellar hook-associated protein 1 FlgK
MWDSKNQALTQIETALNEPSDTGISTMLDKFWNSWQSLSSSPESVPARSSVVDSGIALAGKIQNLYSNMQTLQNETDNEISTKANDINILAKQIATLNKQITSAGTDQSNDLLDSQDLLIDKLSQLTGISVHGTAGSNMIISVGGKALVQGSETNELETTTNASGKSTITWSNDGSELNASGGQLGGLLEVRDDILQTHMDTLNNLTKSIVERVNSEHSKGAGLNGRTGGFFTEGSDASTISVQSDLQTTPAGVAASATGTTGDNTISNAISDIKTDRFLNNQTINETYTGFVSVIATQSKEASTMSKTFDLSVSQLSTQKDSLAGVSLDEELSNMIKFQQSYNAAARIFSVVDDMLDVMINRTGAGR